MQTDKADKLGFKVDNTADLARLLRIPGSFNFKVGKTKRVNFIKDLCSKQKYDPDIFEYWIDTKPTLSNNIALNDAEYYPKGERNTRLFKLGASRRAKGCTDLEIRAIMEASNEKRCDPPLSKRELETLIKSVLKYQAGTNIEIDDSWNNWDAANNATDGTDTTETANNDNLTTNTTANAAVAANAIANNAIANSAKNKAKKTKVTTLNILPCELTDLGNAKRFVNISKGRCYYNVDAKEWTIWDGKKWELDKSFKSHKIAEKVIGLLKAETNSQKDPEIKECFAKWTNTSQSEGHFKAIVNLAKKDLPIRNEKFDTDDMLLNCQNGIVDLKNGTLVPHDEKYLMSKIVNANYDKNAKCDTWLYFLDSVFEGNQDIINFLKRWFGYNLTGKVNEKKFCVMTGAMNNGKSTMLNALKSILGDYAHTCDIASLLSIKDASGSEANSDIANLAGVRYCITSEGKEGQKINDSLVKKLIGGGDEISARRLFQEQFTFSPKLKLSMMTNHVPQIDAADAAMWQRIIYIPFNRIFTGPDIDYNMPDKLAAEAAGILNWMVEGCLEWQQNGLMVPDCLMKSTASLRSSCDPIDNWKFDNCIECDDTVITPRNLLWQDFKDWAHNTNNAEAKKITNDKFSKMMNLKGHRSDKTTHGMVRYFAKIQLRDVQSFEKKSEW